MELGFSRELCRCSCFLGIALICLQSSSYRSEASPNREEIFSDVTGQAGIAWHQFSGESPDRFLIETMGGGVDFLDFDDDGLVDIFLDRKSTRLNSSHL